MRPGYAHTPITFHIGALTVVSCAMEGTEPISSKATKEEILVVAITTRLFCGN